MSRPRAGYIGFNRVPAASAVNSAAGGVWTVREAEALNRAGTWPSSGNVVSAIAGLQLWLDASDASTLFDATTGGSLVTADGGVARWEDKSGNGRHATQGTSGNRPLRKTNQQNALGALLFDGSNDTLTLPSITIPASHTVFSVFVRATASIHSIPLGSEAQPGSTRYSVWWFSDNIVYSNSNGEFSTHGSASTSTGAFLLVDTRTATTSVVTRRNGAQLASVTSGNAVTNAASGTWTHVGSMGGTVHSGNLCEIIVYNSALSDADRAAVESYLMTKWGIS